MTAAEKVQEITRSAREVCGEQWCQVPQTTENL